MMTKISKKLVSVIMALTLMFTGIFASSVYAVTDEEQQKIDDYKKQQQELEQKIKDSEKLIEELKKNKEDKEKYADELSVQIENYQKQIDVLNVNIDGLETEKGTIQTKIDELNTEIDGIETDIEKNEEDVAETESEIQDVYVNLQDRLREVYVNGATSDLELLFDLDESDDFTTYLILSELSQQLAARDEAMVNTLNRDIEKLDELTAEYNKMIDDIEVKRGEHQSKVNELDVKEKEIVNSRTELENSQQSIEDLQAEAFAVIAELDADCDAKQKLIDQYQNEIEAFDKKIDELLKTESSHGDGVIQTGKLIWPLQYSDAYISSGFGYRMLYGRRVFHGGLDTCRRSGTFGANVTAAADGRVIISTYNAGGYGYYVGIDHGNGVVTIYGHNSQLLVSYGQQVKQGQTIALAGSTGNSTGPHVHFEVRINGVKQNPLNYSSLPN